VHGLALSSPDGIFSTSGSTFAFSMFYDEAGTLPLLTSDTVKGFAFLANVNLEGSTTTTNHSSQLSASLQGPVATPEPSAIVLVCAAILLLSLSLPKKYLA
jgi:hypothetical protein